MIPLCFVPRLRPLEPGAVFLPREKVSGLVDRLLRPELNGLALSDGLLVRAAAEELPWCDGARYYALEPRAPALYLPTHEEPNWPLELLQRAVGREVGEPGPWLLEATPLRAFSLTALGPLGAAELERWLGEVQP